MRITRRKLFKKCFELFRNKPGLATELIRGVSLGSTCPLSFPQSPTFKLCQSEAVIEPIRCGSCHSLAVPSYLIEHRTSLERLRSNEIDLPSTIKTIFAHSRRHTIAHCHNMHLLGLDVTVNKGATLP